MLLDFFIINAHAAPGDPQQGGFLSFLPLIVILVLFYFILIRPQMKQAKQHRNMVANLSKGDEVIAAGGILGKIKSINDDYVLLDVGSGHEVIAQKHSVTVVLPKGMIKKAI